MICFFERSQLNFCWTFEGFGTCREFSLEHSTCEQWSTFVQQGLSPFNQPVTSVVAGKFSRSYDGYNKPFETYFVATGLVLGASVPSFERKVAICIPFLSRTVQNNDGSTILVHAIPIVFPSCSNKMWLGFPWSSR
jgi:hypothetical protein